jgi:hypothetical protein
VVADWSLILSLLPFSLICPHTSHTVSHSLTPSHHHTPQDAQKNLKKSLEKGILKILSKMGISLLQCYHGAQIFEAYGLGPDVVDLCFRWVYIHLYESSNEQH